MTQLASTTASHTEYDTRRATIAWALLVFVVSSTWTVLGAHNMTEIIVSLGLATVVTVGVYGFVVPRGLRRGRTGGSTGGMALGLSIPALLLTVPAFWSGLPLILGAAGVMLGHAGRNADSGSGKSITAVVLGALAVIGYLAIYLIDGLLFGNL